MVVVGRELAHPVADRPVVDVPGNAVLVKGDDQVNVPVLDVALDNALDQFLVPPFVRVVL